MGMKTKLLAATGLAAMLGMAATPAMANAPQQPGILSGLSAYAPLPQGLYFVNVLDYGVRNGHAARVQATVEDAVLVYAFPHVGPVAFEVELAQPLVQVGIPNSLDTFGVFNTFLQPIVAVDLGNGLSVGGGFGTFFPESNALTRLFFGGIYTLVGNLGVYYSAPTPNGITLGATGTYGIPVGRDPLASHNQFAEIDLTAYYVLGKWQFGAVGFGELDTTKPTGSAAPWQGEFAAGPLIGYNFGPVVLQARFTHDLAIQHLDGRNNVFWTDLIIPLGFGAPAAPPPAPVPVAAPAPAPSRSYLVFFDWDRADLSDRARQIISEAAQNSTRVQVTQIQVNGYTDTSGSPAYNQKLSIRRAENVAAELVRDGVPQGEIAIMGYGETHLLVPTGPGVREPQNRRVEIIL